MPSKEAYRQAIAPHEGAERNCVKVSGDTVSFSKECFKKAVPKGTFKGVWTPEEREAASAMWTE